MYDILWVNTYPSGNILTFIRSCQNFPEIRIKCHKCLQHLCKCVNWHQTIHVRNTRVRHIIFVRSVTYCECWMCIGSLLTNYSQHIWQLWDNTMPHIFSGDGVDGIEDYRGGGASKPYQGEGKYAEVEADVDSERGMSRDVKEYDLGPVLWAYEPGRAFLWSCPIMTPKMGYGALVYHNHIM